MSKHPLADCPFCGSDEVTVSSADVDEHYGFCEWRFAQGPVRLTAEEATRLWNRRSVRLPVESGLSG